MGFDEGGHESKPLSMSLRGRRSKYERHTDAENAHRNAKDFSWAMSSSRPLSRPLPSTTEDVMFTSDTTECAGCIAGVSEVKTR